MQIGASCILLQSFKTRCRPSLLRLFSLNFFSCFRMAWWESNHYTSTCLPSEESESEEEFEEGEAGLNVDLDYRDVDLNCIKYIMGDVTHPKAEEEDAIIVHCLGRTYDNRTIVKWAEQGAELNFLAWYFLISYQTEIILSLT
mgnify:FL=1